MPTNKIAITLSSLAAALLVSCSNSTTVSDQTNPVVADKKFPAAFPYKDSKTQVISPYKPYNVINVKGLKSGHLARDVSTAKVDKSTGKPDLSTAKIFRVPEFTNSTAAKN
ncbi:hypothetical protein ACFSW8_04840 [Rubritalea tangerina]|uniref:Uncharacterized protein n=2 Tax=Rubritalea tangerina TaxID=430798 RepID=A0ABW4Z8A7_9BACT